MPFSRLGKIGTALVWTALAVTLAFHLWAARRGLEMTDEASYLLIALDPWHTWGHGTFHGFLLRPLYLFAGSSVVGLRWIGYAILLAAAWRLAGAVGLHLGSPRRRLAALCAPVLMVAALTCYSAGMRTPCYNWMILVGALWMWSGWLRCRREPFGPWELGLGLAIALIGKWGAALVLFGLLVSLSRLTKGKMWGPSRKEWGQAAAAFAVAIGLIAFYAGGNGILDTLRAGILIAQTTGSHGWFIVPKYGWEIFYYLYRIGRAFVWLVPPILAFWWLARRDPKKWTIEKIVTILFLAGFSLAALRGWWRGGIEQFGKESVLAGCWLLGVVWTVWAVRRKMDDGGQWPEAGVRGTEVGVPCLVLWALVLTPFLCGIGTNTSIADYAGQGTVFFAAAGILLLGSVSPAVLPTAPIVALTGLCLIQGSRVSTSLLGLYRVGSVLHQTELLDQGPEAKKLQVDPQTAREIHDLARLLSTSGFRAGDPVVGVDSLCGWVYLSGATSPGVPWFFRDQGSYLSAVLSLVDPAVLRRTWVWLRSSSHFQEMTEWWPTAVVPPPFCRAGQIILETDRGREPMVVIRPPFLP